MSKTVFALLTAVIVVAILAGGTAFILQQKKLSAFRDHITHAEEKIKAGQLDEAIPLLKRVDTDGGNPRACFLLGKIYYDRGEFQQAQAWFRKIKEKFPKSDYVSQALLYDGRYALEQQKDPEKAIESFLKVITNYPNSEAKDFALLHLARISYEKGDFAQTRKVLDPIIKKSGSPARSDAEFLLGDMNMAALLGPEPQPGDEVYTIQKGDRLISMAKKLNVPMDLIIAINKINPNSMSIGRQIKIPRLTLSVVIDKGERTLTLKNNNQLLKKYRVGINRSEKLIPAGDYVVTTKSDKPEYIDPDTGQSLKAGTPQNPLGTRYMILRRDIGIHGTNKPEEIGTYTNKGWISMKNEDVEELYGLVQPNRTPVTIRGQNLLEENSPGNSR